MVTAFAAGEKVTAARINEIAETSGAIADSSTLNTAGTTTSTSFTATLTGGTACGFAFTAPDSGKVEVNNSLQLSNGGADFSACAIQVRTGSTVGSGTIVLAASLAEAVTSVGLSRQGSSQLMTGLTPGSVYNVQQLFAVGGGTGTFERKHLEVKPQAY